MGSKGTGVYRFLSLRNGKRDKKQKNLVGTQMQQHAYPVSLVQGLCQLWSGDATSTLSHTLTLSHNENGCEQLEWTLCLHFLPMKMDADKSAITQ